MLVAHYNNRTTGDLGARMGRYLTRLVQKGPYGDITHAEAIHAEHADGSVTIASSSLRDGGVRTKRVQLNPNHWLIVDVPQWDVEQSIDLLDATNGMPYDLRGAVATMLPGAPKAAGFSAITGSASPSLRRLKPLARITFAPSLCRLAKTSPNSFFQKGKAHEPDRKPACCDARISSCH